MPLDRILRSRVKQELREDYLYGDKAILVLLILHWIVASSLTALSYNTYLFGFVNGAIISSIAVLVYVLYKGTAASRMIFGALLVMYPMIFIQQHLGRIEMHFHVFVSIAFLTVYKDMRPVLIGGLITTIHHVIGNELQAREMTFFDVPVTIFNYGCGWDIVILHASFVVLEVAALMLFLQVSRKRFIGMIKAKFKLQELSARQEMEIKQRTNEYLSAKEDAEAANRAKSSFLANMSHEIRTPLNAILGFVDILQEQETDLEKSKYIKTIKKSGDSLVEIINDILDFAKVESDKLSIECIPVNPHEEFDNIGSLFFAKGEELGLKFSIYIDPALPTCIEVDPLRIRQVVTNLLSNAMKFSKTGQRVLLSVKYDILKKTILIVVQDSGIGIAKENQAKVFEAFSQAEDSTTREFGGTGLGLAISSRLVSLMGSELKLRSEIGVGSEFYFTIETNECEETCGFDVIPKLDGLDVVMLCPREQGDYAETLEEYLRSFGINKIVHAQKLDEIEQMDSALVVINSTMFTVEEVKGLLEKGYQTIMIKASLSENYSNVFSKNIIVVDPPFTPSKVYDALVCLYVDQAKEKVTYSDRSIPLDGHVLVAEDQEANQYLMSVILKRLNLEYSFADDGVEAVRMFENGKYDLIFMDENMPNMNGTEATSKIVEIEEEKGLVHTPIVALTANALKGDRERFLEAGMDDYLTKPIDKVKMLEVLHKYLHSSNNEEEKVIETDKQEEPQPVKTEEKRNVGLDLDLLAEKMGYDKEDIEVMLGMFMNKVDIQLDLIEESIRDKNYETVFTTTHAIKGSVGNLGLDEIFEIAKTIEAAAKNKDEIPYEEHFQKMKALIKNIQGLTDE